MIWKRFINEILFCLAGKWGMCIKNKQFLFAYIRFYNCISEEVLQKFQAVWVMGVVLLEINYLVPTQ